ncbi:MAG: cache domain-containing protein [Ferruginibacter sp.]
MTVKSLIPTRRRLTFSMIILSLIAIFFIGYYFYYLPGNRNILHKNGFLILQKIQQNIKDRNDYLQTSFKNILEERKNDGSEKDLAQLQDQLNNYRVGGKIFKKNDTISRGTGNAKSKSADNSQIDDDSTIYLYKISKDSLFYKRSNADNKFFQVYVPVDKFVDPILTNQKSELFESYLLIGESNGVIYIDPGLAINSRIAEDSLIAKNSKALFAGTKDITISGIDYKMFYYPFKLGPEHFQLCGFIKSETYNEKLQQVPVAFIYPIVIALLLIIILLPIVKFYLIGKDEHVKYADFVMGLISFFAGTAMMTLIIIQVLLLWAADIRTKKYLEEISAQIDYRFTAELAKAYKQLNILDTLIVNNPNQEPVQKMLRHENFNAFDLITGYYKDCHQDTSCYYNFNRVSWIDEDGDQHIKADIDTSGLVFTNVKERGYFKILQNNQAYALPGIPGSRCVIEPVNSWTNGDFSLIIAMKSKFGNGSIIAMSIQMPSVMRTILPPGFGFGIIDNDGKVMLHSDMSRNLQENLIAKTDPSRQIRETVKSRQESFFSSLNLYGKNNSVYVKPIATLPFHLATFYDTGYVVPVNMRIFTFSLLFCSISSAICILLWLGVFRRRSSHNALLYDPMYYLKWVVPKERNIRFYILSIFFLIICLLFQLLMLLLAKSFDNSNYTILMMVIVFPINIFSGLFIINYRIKRNSYAGSIDTNKDQKKLNPIKALSALFFQPVAILTTYFLSISGEYGSQNTFLFFELVFFIFISLFLFLRKGAFKFLYRNAVSYLSFYCWFSTILLICISVVPAALYTWYAHNQEITQSVKKEQLYLANALQQRAVYTFDFVKKRSALLPPGDYFERLQYKTGIYAVFGDSIEQDAVMDSATQQKESYEKFYFAVADEIGNNYYDPLLMPALKNTATGNAWYWTPLKDSLSFWYSVYLNPKTDTTSQVNPGKALKITSAYPERYEFVAASFRGISLLLVVAGFVYGLYLLLRFMSAQMFLRKFIPYSEDKADFQIDGIYSFFQEYKRSKEEWGNPASLMQESDIAGFEKEYDYFRPVQNSRVAYQQEIAMISAQDRYRDFYFFIWDKCKPKEKYLLLDFAKNGFVNFKNTEVIYNLLKKDIFIIQKEEIKLFSASFRAFVLLQRQSKEMIGLQKEFQQGSAWQTVRIPLLIVLFGIAFFVFFTQEQTFQKVTALVAGVSTIFSLLVKFFSDGSGIFSSKK